jgi:hypothetical protein
VHCRVVLGRRVPLCHGIELCHLLVTQRAVPIETLTENETDARAF